MVDTIIEVKEFPNKGRGVVVTKKVTKGETLERAPISSFPAEQRSKVNSTQIFEHYFVDAEQYKSSKNGPGYIVYGLISIVNHSPEPNAEVEWQLDGEEGWATLRLLKDLKDGEEVTIAYTNVDEYQNTEHWVA